MDELTQRLASDQPVTVGGPKPSVEDLRSRLEHIGIVFIKFTGTRGGTDLGVRLDRTASDLSAADFDKSSGTVHVEGTLILNDDPVRCIADIDLATLDGTGRLVLVEESELVG
jgi:Core binding factor beta subunit